MLLVVLIALVVGMMLIRRRQNKHPVPTRVRNTIYDIRNRFSPAAPPPYSENGNIRVENQYDVTEGAMGGADNDKAPCNVRILLCMG